MDGIQLTLYRASCVSGLASLVLSRNYSNVLIMVGACALAPHLIIAHIAARLSIKRVLTSSLIGGVFFFFFSSRTIRTADWLAGLYAKWC